MLLATALLIIGLLLVVYSADRLVFAASILCRRMHLPPLIIGMTVVSIGTSLPEIIVSVSASSHGQISLETGTAIGSNIINILRRELPLMLVVSLLAGFVLYDGQLSRDYRVMVLVSIIFPCCAGAVIHRLVKVPARC